MDVRFSLNPDLDHTGEAKFWAAFSDIALAMLLVFMLFILAQFLHYEQIFVLEEIERRKAQVENSVTQTAEDWQGVGVTVVDEDGLHQRIRITGGLVFEPCRDALSSTGRLVLEGLGAVLSESGPYFTSVQVEGHADRQGATGLVCRQAGIEDNWQLSARRATEVVRLFATTGAFPGDVLSSVGRGEFHPLSAPSDTTAAALAVDRRIEVVLRYSEEHALASLGAPDA